jgi:hypothetical protein
MGFNMTPEAVNVLVKRYSFKGQDQVQFDDFVAVGDGLARSLLHSPVRVC